MRIEFITSLKKDNKGINELLKLIGRKGRISFDFKKGKIAIEDFSIEKIDNILNIIRFYFDITYIGLNNEKKFKLRNDEKELQNKKNQITENINKKPTTIISQVQAYILKEKVFTLTQLREAFPNTNFATLRSYVKDMKKENILINIDKGKYSVR